jgi:ABC-2 type transport system permease protein
LSVQAIGNGNHMKKINTIIRKEWAEVFKNKMVLFTVIFLPLILTALPLGIMIGIGSLGDLGGASSELPGQFRALCAEGLDDGECFLVYMVNQFMLLFMLVPLAIPTSIAAYSIVGEKTTRSLEPILATPITTIELLMGKSLAAVIPAVLATFVAFGIFLAGTWIVIPDRDLFLAIADSRWLLAVFLVGPLMAILSVMASIMVSSRVNDPRAAEQIAMIIILPLLIVFFGQIAGLFIVNRQFVFLSAIVLLFLDAIMAYLAVQLFQRETILTRWR